MADAPPSKSDIQHIFKRLSSSAANKQCFDCASANPTWASVTYGVFLCIDCSAVHRSLGVHLTFIRSTQLDTNWTWVQLRAMQVGGNANAAAFFRGQGCTTKDAQQKYNSRAAHLYKEKLHQLALSTQRINGAKLYVDGSEGVTKQPTAGEEADFFKEQEKWGTGAAGDVWHDVASERTAVNGSRTVYTDQPVAVAAEEQPAGASSSDGTELSGPSVEAALSGHIPTTEPRKSTIGAKKPASAKKGGLGATRVKANFSDIEVQAQQRDKAKEESEKAAAVAQVVSAEDAQKKMASLKLAYQDLSTEQKKQEERLRHLDPKKAEQAERLGMGFAASSSSSATRCISHSAVSDMKTIEQETPTVGRSFATERLSASSSSRSRWEDDAAEVIDSPPRYGSKSIDDFGAGGSSGKSTWDSFDSKKPSATKSSWDTEKFESTTSFFEENMSSKEKERTSRSRKPDSARASSTKDGVPASDVYSKYSGAKSISSSQLFGESQGQGSSGGFTRFEGSSAISSDDYFGGDSHTKRPPSYSGHAPDLQDIKDGVRQGVTKVATKLSTLASGVMSSIQDRLEN